jgi:hypothetical protein
VSTSSTRSTRLPSRRGFASSVPEGALQVLLALRLGEADLALRTLQAGEQKQVARDAASLRDPGRQRHGLIEPPLPKAPAVERNGHDEISIREELGPGPHHHAPHRFGEFEAVAVFEPVDEGLHRLFVASHGACALEHGRVGDGGGRVQRPAIIDRERGAEAFAVGPLDKAQARPAAGAKAVRISGGSAAGNARGRIDDADEGVRDRAHHPSGVAGPGPALCLRLAHPPRLAAASSRPNANGRDETRPFRKTSGG